MKDGDWPIEFLHRLAKDLGIDEDMLMEKALQILAAMNGGGKEDAD